MFAIMTVTGVDHTGIIAAVTTQLAASEVNILDVSQTLMEGYFTMILRVDLGSTPIGELQEELDRIGQEQNLVIRVQSEALFTAVNEI